MELHEFLGLGIDEHWVGRFPKGPLEWFSQPKVNTFISRNPFDLLNVCFMIELLAGDILVEEVIATYQVIENGRPNTYEMLVGKGNAYYNSGQYLNAEKEYLPAL